MPTFIDESGDTGTGRGSLPFFRLAAVWVPDLNAAESFRERVRIVRNELGLKERHEFKFAKTHDKPAHREAFFHAALGGEFRFAVCCIEKRGDCVKLPAAVMHEECAISLAAGLRSHYIAQEALFADREGSHRNDLREMVTVDDNGDRSFLRIVHDAFTALKSPVHPAVSLVSKVKFAGSGPEELLQLVDMLCGATGAHISGEGSSWFHLVQDRCADLTIFPLANKRG